MTRASSPRRSGLRERRSGDRATSVHDFWGKNESPQKAWTHMRLLCVVDFCLIFPRFGGPGRGRVPVVGRSVSARLVFATFCLLLWLLTVFKFGLSTSSASATLSGITASVVFVQPKPPLKPA